LTRWFRPAGVYSADRDNGAKAPPSRNALLGTRFRIVTGYNGTVALAMEWGEVQGIGDWSWPLGYKPN